MNLKGPVEVVFDTSVIIGAILESHGKDTGDASRNALEALKERPGHILRISKEIRKECEANLEHKGWPSYWILKMLFAPLELKEKIKKCQYRPEDIELNVSVPEHDRHVIEAAVAVKGKRRGINVCIVHKNPKDFEPIKEEMYEKHDISVLKPEEYVDP